MTPSCQLFFSLAIVACSYMHVKACTANLTLVYTPLPPQCHGYEDTWSPPSSCDSTTMPVDLPPVHVSVQWFEANARLSAKEFNEFKTTSFLDLQKALSCLQNQQQNSRTMMYMRRLRPFLDSMEQHIQNAKEFMSTSDFSGLLWVSNASKSVLLK